MKTFSIPVVWQMWDKVEIEAETIEEAVQYLRENIEDIPLGKGEYVDHSHRIDDGQDGNLDMAATIKYLKEYWDISGGITGDEIVNEENEDVLPFSTFEIGDDVKGKIYDITNTDHYLNPPITYLDEVEDDCWKLFKKYAALVGVEFDEDSDVDFVVVKELSEQFIIAAQETFEIEFPAKLYEAMDSTIIDDEEMEQ